MDNEWYKYNSGLEQVDIYRVARIAYDAYGAVTDHKNYQGLPMPPFDDLTPRIKEAWRLACLAVLAGTGR